MADDDEWAKFQAEIAAVEQAPTDEAAPVALPPPSLPPPVQPPPNRATVSAVAQAPAVVRKPPAPAADGGPQFSAPHGAPPHMPPPPMGGPPGFQQGFGGPMGGGPMGGYGGGGMGYGGGMGMGMGMGMGGGGMMQQQQQQQQQQGGAAGAAGAGGSKPGAKKKALLRSAGGEKWVDPTLVEWPENDFRIFVGDIGNEVTDDLLAKSFSKYSSFARARIVRDPRTKKSKGYGFVSFLDGNDFAKALREMNGKYIGNRPCKLSKSNWEERTVRKVTLKEKGGGNDAKRQKK